jgi:ABC-type sugar transport system ATPase subunit
VPEDPSSPATLDGDGDAPVIRARGLTKTFGHVRALRGVSLDLRAGEVVAVFGDNGAGKSTLTKCLCGVYTPDSGTIEIGSRTVTLRSPRDTEAHGVTTVHQDLALAPHLSVLENVFLGHEMLHGGLRRRFGVLARRAMAGRSEAALQRLSIQLPSVYVPVSALSEGQKQAVAIARAVLWSTTGILMDEPTASLGTRQSDIVSGLIRSSADHGLAVLVISHDIPRILEVADRVVVLRQGAVALSNAMPAVSRRDVIDAMVGYVEQGE